jgi:hypothetical protein
MNIHGDISPKAIRMNNNKSNACKSKVAVSND